MKRIFFLLLISILAIESQSQDIDSAIHLQDGTIVDKSHVFLDGDSPTFYLRDGQCDNIVWNLYTYSKKDWEGEKKLLLKSAHNCDHFSFDICPELFPGYSLSRGEISRTRLPNDSSVYFRFYLELRQYGNLTDRISFLLNVLPSHPKIEEGAVIGNFNYDEPEGGMFDPLAHLSLIFSCNRMEDHRLWGYFTDSFNIFQYPSDDDIRVMAFYETDIEKIATNLYQLDFDSVDWGQFYRIVPHNKYGYVYGDSFCTNDYIHDEKILKFLDKYHEERIKWLLGIDDIIYDSFQITISNNMLFLPRREDEDDVTEIYRQYKMVSSSLQIITLTLVI